jgi:hypothetical protein
LYKIQLNLPNDCFHCFHRRSTLEVTSIWRATHPLFHVSFHVSLHASLHASFHASLRASLHVSLCASLCASLHVHSVRHSVRLSVCHSVRHSMRLSVRLSVRHSVRYSMHHSVRHSRKSIRMDQAHLNAIYLISYAFFKDDEASSTEGTPLRKPQEIISDKTAKTAITINNE